MLDELLVTNYIEAIDEDDVIICDDDEVELEVIEVIDFEILIVHFLLLEIDENEYTPIQTELEDGMLDEVDELEVNIMLLAVMELNDAELTDVEDEVELYDEAGYVTENLEWLQLVIKLTEAVE